MAGVHPTRNVLCIDNVETKPAERTTANGEDCQRRGFEIQTIIAWPRREGLIDVASPLRLAELPEVIEDVIATGPGTQDNQMRRFGAILDLFAAENVTLFGIDPDRWNFAIYLRDSVPGSLDCIA
jgi:hypothetical protein